MVSRAVALCRHRTVAQVRRVPGLVAHNGSTVEHGAPRCSVLPLAGGAGGGPRLTVHCELTVARQSAARAGGTEDQRLPARLAQRQRALSQVAGVLGQLQATSTAEQRASTEAQREAEDATRRPAR